jgi:exodeoxyribonuclease VII large subunit
MGDISLYELNNHIRQVLAINFDELHWVRAEISSARMSRGHWYIELIQKDPDSEVIMAQSSAVIWAGEFEQIKRRQGDGFKELLQHGAEIKALVEVTFHERYGLKLVIKDIDISHTLGSLELKKRAVLERLQKENLLGLNKNINLPDVLQKIAIISSSTAAGYQDFVQQVKNNPYGFDIQLTLLEAAMQGDRVSREVSAHLIQMQYGDFDAVVIIRGGGSRMDLADFDDYNIARAIALCELPVLTGIGHDIDTSIADLVAHSQFKTPTAVAAFLVEQAHQNDLTLDQFLAYLYDWASTKIYQEQLQFNRLQTQFYKQAQQQSQQAQLQITRFKHHLQQVAMAQLHLEKQSLAKWENNLEMADFRKMLEKGYSVGTVDGKVIQSTLDLTEGMDIYHWYKDGKTLSTIKKIQHG